MIGTGYGRKRGPWRRRSGMKQGMQDTRATSAGMTLRCTEPRSRYRLLWWTALRRHDILSARSTAARRTSQDWPDKGKVYLG